MPPFGTLLYAVHVLRLCQYNGVGGTRQGCEAYKRTTKSFDLLKIPAKSLKIWANWRLTLFIFKTLRPKFAEKYM